MLTRPLTRWPILLAAIVGTATLATAEPTTAPTLVDVTDQTAITANLNKDVLLEGVVMGCLDFRRGLAQTLPRFAEFA